MNFVHLADMHFDIPFTSLSNREDLGEKRRLEQRKIFKKAIDYIKENNIEYFFISGDLYEHEYVKKSTIEYIANLFRQIPYTKIFITPGNHDPYIKNSFYEIFDFGDNVNIFSNSYIERYEDDEVNIYGMAFTDFYMNESQIEKIKLKENDKLNILIAHADLNGSKDKNGMSYNPILESKIKQIGFDYVALGHIHKNNLENKNRIYYPGSPISMGCDELGDHGMIVGELSKESLNINFIKLDDRKFEEIEVNVDYVNSKEDLIERILNLDLDSINMYKIILKGKRNFEINPREILRALQNTNVLKIKNLTKLNYDIEELASQRNLKGIFVKEVINMYKQGLCTEEEYQKAIEIGLEAM